MEMIQFHPEYIHAFIDENTLKGYKGRAEQANKALHEGNGPGNNFLGWVNLPANTSSTSTRAIQDIAENFKDKLDVVISIGIGGSYLGTRAVIEALSDSFSTLKKGKHPLVLYAGQNISEDYLAELREVLHDVSWGIVVISKSGTTTEPAIAFRILKNDLESQYGKEEAGNRIIAITDAQKGALRKLADEENYTSFVIPDDVGGRYSVLTPVGLVPIAIAGIDIQQLLQGAEDMAKKTNAAIPFDNNPAALYAAIRNILFKQGKTTEILVNYTPKLATFMEWWKQLFGESEGKDGKGIFPASVNFTTDLHSLGQFIQDGTRNLFETVLTVKNPAHNLTIPRDEANLDKLNYLAGKNIDAVNKQAEAGTRIAHIDGNVPNTMLEIPELSAYYLGQLVYFFEKACGISGYLLGVNPFDQPGVEAYKQNMFALLNKPGFEEKGEKLRERMR